MNRRNFIIKSSSGAVTLSAGMWMPDLWHDNFETESCKPIQMRKEGFFYSFAEVSQIKNIRIPEEKRLPFGWSAFAVLPDQEDGGPLLKWEDIPTGDKRCLFRISIALDVREELLVEAVLAQTGEVVGCFDIRYAPVHQIQTVPVEIQNIKEILKQGIRLRMKKGDSPLFIVSPASEFQGEVKAMLPHLMVPGNGDPLDAFFDRLFSLDSVQQFGWMEGCVTDGLRDLAAVPKFKSRAQEALKLHLDHFLEGDNLVYENPRSQAMDNKIYGVECTLPFAAICQIYPNHPSIDLAVEYWMNRYNEGIIDHEVYNITAEGSYTVAYPMMVIGKNRGDSRLIDRSIKRLRIRRGYLKYEDAIYLRHKPSGHRSFRNWARGIAWYMLGLIRSLMVLEPENRPKDLVREVFDISEWIVSHQMKSGLWRCFVDERGVRLDTSGSAGIAAALALGAKSKMLSENYRSSASMALDSLKDHLSDDGLLIGAAQSNRGGEKLQRGDYRVPYQMGMGLMGQLIAALDD